MKHLLFLIISITILQNVAVSLNISTPSLRLDTAFTDINAGFPGSSAAFWGDYDNDGNLDLLLVGGLDSSVIYQSRIYHNDGGMFHNIGAVLTIGNKAAWGDYDSDGDLDIVISGPTGSNSSNPVTKIYRNASGTFVDINAPLLGLVGSVAWSDYDNDGDLDLFVTGSTDNGFTYYGKLYRNDNGNFVDIGANLPGMWGSSVAWGDYDNDGDLDLLIAGYAPGNYATRLFRNDNGVFVDVGAPLQTVNGSSVAWGDYDNDGDLDIFLCGDTPGPENAFTTIYRNDEGNFVDIHPGIIGVDASFAAWGDFDSDGHMDVIESGSSALYGYGDLVTKIYRNSNGLFTDISAALPGIGYGSVSWGDYDNDGDLDILIAGLTSTTPPYNFITKIYRNNLGSNTFTTNTPPTVPNGLTAIVSRNNVALTWNKSTDSQTPQNGLTYNIRLGITSNGVEKVSPMADVASGYRKVVQLGNTNHDTTWTIKNLPQGTYYWSVQAIDNTFAGSGFATEQSFTMTQRLPGAAPYLVSVKDIPHDQGGYVTLKWEASSLDTDVNQLPFYSIWRALPESSSLIGPIITPQAVVLELRGPVYRIAKLNGTDYTWEWIANLPAHKFLFYSYTAPTLYDSMSTTDGKHYFLVSAHTSNPNIFYDSNVDSGYSIDNLAPSVPQNLSAQYVSGTVRLHWNSNAESDFEHYAVYRSTSPNINPTILSPFIVTKDTEFVDANPMGGSVLYYAIYARDMHGNLSLQSNVVAVDLTGLSQVTGELPTVSALYQNYPNPFNPGTTIVFDVAKDGFVTLSLFNTLGQEISRLVNQTLAAAHYRISLDASHLLSGVYLYRLTVREAETGKHIFNQTKKFLLLK